VEVHISKNSQGFDKEYIKTVIKVSVKETILKIKNCPKEFVEMDKKKALIIFGEKSVNYSILTVKHLMFYTVVTIKRIYKLIIILIIVCYKSIVEIFQYTFFYLNEVLTRKELINLLGFVFGFLFCFIITDKISNSKIKYPKTKAPNVLWRIVTVLIYFPLWLNCLGPFAIYIKNHSKERTFTFITKRFLNRLRYLLRCQSAFENALVGGRFGFLNLWQLMTYYGYRIFTARVKPEIFRIPMYTRYHLLNASLTIVIYQLLLRPFRTLVGIDKPYDPFDFSRIPMKNPKLTLRLSWVMFTVMLILITRGTWTAMRGKSFNKGPIDLQVRTHLSSFGLYYDERWSDFGMDETLNSDYDDI
jgi:hypothetical protein